MTQLEDKAAVWTHGCSSASCPSCGRQRSLPVLASSAEGKETLARRAAWPPISCLGQRWACRIHGPVRPFQSRAGPSKLG